MGSDPPVCGVVVVMEGVIVGAGSSAGAWFRDPAWRGDDTLGEVGNLGGVVSVLAGAGSGVGNEGS